MGNMDWNVVVPAALSAMVATLTVFVGWQKQRTDAALARADDELAARAQAFQELFTLIDQLQTRNATLNERVARQDERIAQLESAREGDHAAIDKLRSEKREMQDELAELRPLRGEVAELRAENAALKRRVESFTAKLRAAGITPEPDAPRPTRRKKKTE